MNKVGTPSHILLLGAGFSRNWGGWLADEVVNYLLSAPEVSSDPHLKDVIWRNADSGFESALEEVQLASANELSSEETRQQLAAFERALIRMFTEMNGAFFKEPNFEFSNQVALSVRGFLANFDAIFTLNQDLLLEHHYIDNFNVSLVSPRRWDAVQIPGLRRFPHEEPLFSGSWARASWQPLPDVEFSISTRSQPYIKLHGSSNWFSADGQRVLVMGSNKTGQIQRHKILSRYALEFRTRISIPDTRLVVIGYGFKDHHINKDIAQAVFQHNLKMFVVSPEGRNAAKAFSGGPHPEAALVAFGYDLKEVFRRGFDGASQRPLSEIFGGSDPDHSRLLSFIGMNRRAREGI